MSKTLHTHTGTCQACGRQQAVGNDTGRIAKHGYTVDWGYFNGVCHGAGKQPAEVDVTYTRRLIVECGRDAELNDRAAEQFKTRERIHPQGRL
jgi:hypothetical protein